MPDTPRATSRTHQLAQGESISWGGETGWENELVDQRYISLANGAIIPNRVRGPTEGLVAHWEFEDPTTPTATDSIGANNATINGATYAGTGRVGSDSLEFDPGERNSLTFTSSELDIQGSFTISVWARMDGNAPEGWQRIYQKGRSKADRTVELYLADGNNDEVTGSFGLRVNQETASQTTEHRQRPPEFSFGTYYHYTVMYDAVNSQLRAYRDGTLLGSTPHSGGIDSNTQHTIGNWTSSGGRPWNGRLDDLRIYNRALPSTDVESLYEALL